MNAQKKAQPPSAAARTISMFDGQTDADRKTIARDGTQGEERQRKAPPPRLRWFPVSGRMGSWELVDRRRPGSLAVATIEALDGEFVAKIKGVANQCARLPTMAAASLFVEQELRRE